MDTAKQRAKAKWFLVESAFRFSWLLEHDLFRKPVSTLGSSPRAGFFGIML
jgi:hypothetical protein